MFNLLIRLKVFVNDSSVDKFCKKLYPTCKFHNLFDLTKILRKTKIYEESSSRQKESQLLLATDFHQSSIIVHHSSYLDQVYKICSILKNN